MMSRPSALLFVPPVSLLLLCLCAALSSTPLFPCFFSLCSLALLLSLRSLLSLLLLFLSPQLLVSSARRSPLSPLVHFPRPVLPLRSAPLPSFPPLLLPGFSHPVFRHPPSCPSSAPSPSPTPAQRNPPHPDDAVNYWRSPLCLAPPASRQVGWVGGADDQHAFSFRAEGFAGGPFSRYFFEDNVSTVPLGGSFRARASHH